METEELKEQTDAIAEGGGMHGFSRAVALTVAVVAVFTMLCRVKADNNKQNMLQVQAEELDHWNHYQAKSTKQQLFQIQTEQWRLQEGLAGSSLTADARAKLEAAVAHWQSEVDRYESDKKDLQQKAEAAHKAYDDMNFRDDQFDLSEALIGLAITLLAISGLIGSKPLYGLGVAVALFGVVMGLAGFFGWPIHPGVIRFLT